MAWNSVFHGEQEWLLWSSGMISQVVRGRSDMVWEARRSAAIVPRYIILLIYISPVSWRGRCYSNTSSRKHSPHLYCDPDQQPAEVTETSGGGQWCCRVDTMSTLAPLTEMAPGSPRTRNWNHSPRGMVGGALSPFLVTQQLTGAKAWQLGSPGSSSSSLTYLLLRWLFRSPHRMLCGN